MESQLEAVRQEIRSAKDEIVEVKQELAIAKQAGNKGGEKEVRFLRGRLEKLDSQMLSLNEKENILLRSQAPGKFTLKNLISRPFPPLDARLSSRSSNSKTILSAPRTFEDILPWPQLLLQARELEDSLDDTLHLYDNISFTYTPNLAISSAADECEVRVHL